VKRREDGGGGDDEDGSFTDRKAQRPELRAVLIDGAVVEDRLGRLFRTGGGAQAAGVAPKGVSGCFAGG
jgi:hypothetical protein